MKNPPEDYESRSNIMWTATWALNTLIAMGKSTDWEVPKGSPFDAILDEEMRRIDRMLNDRPLKCLNWRTPREAYTALLYRHLLAAA